MEKGRIHLRCKGKRNDKRPVRNNRLSNSMAPVLLYTIRDGKPESLYSQYVRSSSTADKGGDKSWDSVVCSDQRNNKKSRILPVTSLAKTILCLFSIYY